MVMTNLTLSSSTPLSSTSAALSVPELLLLTEALVQLAQQSQQTQQVSLAEVDWSSIASMLASRYPLGSSDSLTPTLLSSELLAHLSALSSASSSSSVPLAALITLSTSLKQQRLQQLKDEYAASTTRQQQLEEQVKATASYSSSLPTARADLPIPPSFPAQSSTPAGYPSTPLLMSPLQRSVSEKSRLPSTPLPPTAASIAHMPPLEESTMSEPADAATSSAQSTKEDAAAVVVKSEVVMKFQVTPPPPMMRTITDMELDREPAAEPAVDDVDLTTQPQQQQQQQQQEAAEEQSEAVPVLDTVDESSSSTSSTPPVTSSSPTSRAFSASLAVTCLEILACLQRHPDADPFRYPVDPTEVPNYYDTIRQPMDFDTIQKQLVQQQSSSGSQQSVIATPQQFHERLLLVFQNAYAFNDKKTSFYKMAKNLDAFAAELCRKYWPEEKKSFFASPEARKLTGRQSKGGVVGGGVKELELDTPVGVMVVGVVSAPSSPANERDGSVSSNGAEDDASAGAEETEVAGGRKVGKGGRSASQSVASTPTGAGERMGTRKGVKGSKVEEESASAAASAAEADDGKAAGRKKVVDTGNKGRGTSRRKSERGETEEEEKVQEEAKQQETPKASRRGGRGRSRGH